jgi:DNA-binding response OmpR family regulator
VVDDDADLRQTLDDILQAHGFDVVTAADGNDALEKFPKHPIDAVLLDVIMPDKDGLETLVAMKRVRPDVCIISMSGGGQRKNDAFLVAAKRCGADAVLAKPFEASDLVRLLRETLVGRPAADSTEAAPASGPRYVARPLSDAGRPKRH